MSFTQEEGIVMRKNRFLIRLSAGAFVIVVAAGAVLLTDGVSDAASTAASPQVTTTTTPISPAITLSTSPISPVTYGTPVTLTATIDQAAAGTVQFKDNNTNLGGPMFVNNRNASMPISTLTGGRHPLTAEFTPNPTDSATYGPSTSNTVTLVVKQSTILTGFTGSIDLLPPAGIDLAAKLTTTDGPPVASRRIDFRAGRQELCTASTDVNGWARCSAPENWGPQTVKELFGGYDAAFSGDDEYFPSSQQVSATIGTAPPKP
jgi:hypothetical protein